MRESATRHLKSDIGLSGGIPHSEDTPGDAAVPDPSEAETCESERAREKELVVVAPGVQKITYGPGCERPKIEFIPEISVTRKSSGELY
jgi:hypothetical protein